MRRVLSLNANFRIAVNNRVVPIDGLILTTPGDAKADGGGAQPCIPKVTRERAGSNAFGGVLLGKALTQRSEMPHHGCT